MRIFLVGGGTGGPTAPLIAVARQIRKREPETEFFFVGSGSVSERKLLSDSGFPIKILSVPAGKWRRYFSLWNLVDIFKFFFGFIRALFLIKRVRPDLVFGAGSFVQVPVAWAAFFCHVPVVVHQQDVRLLLATRLAAPVAKAVTATFDFAALDLAAFSGMFKKIPKSKVVTTGNPIRLDVLSGTRAEAERIFKLNSNFPTVLALGGATGSVRMNEVVRKSLPELLKYVQLIHVTGPDKAGTVVSPHYHAYEFLGAEELRHAYAAADLVVGRAGMSTISELSALGKPAILVPLPDSAQEDNARLLAFFKSAVVVFQEFFDAELLVRLVRKMLWSADLPASLSRNIKKLMPHDAAERVVKVLMKVYAESRK